MASIKVSYQNTVRRFLVPKTITWSELESNLRTLFSLPPTSFALSYTDEDGDVITLSSDLELQDIFSQVQQSTTLRFFLIPYNKKHEDNESNSKQVVDQPSQPSLHDSPNSQQLTVADSEPSSIPTPSSVKGKQKAEMSNDDNSDPSILDEQCNEEQTRAPFIDLATQFQKVIDKLRPMIEQQPQLIEQANNIMDQILRNIPVDIDQWTQWFNEKVAEAQRNFYNAINNEDDDEKQMSSAQQQSEELFFNPQNVINNNSTQHVNQVIYDFQNEQLVDKKTKEKLEILRSMGFYDDNRNKELLKIHQGNVERVVEILVEDSEYSVVDNEVQMVEI
ncbi:8486_t:CDS:1 [Acaulospora morrowiae]|uniref:8486_t:CDS:1 n=1 Tax=Acaulospora morrowiae TaxID=94023 RepID=A0A9N9BK75_9GLOM|nr:8486_t:CDS:1 [Acaulospora morrowiae]